MDALGDEGLVSAQTDDHVEKGRRSLDPTTRWGPPSDDLDILAIHDRQDSTTTSRAKAASTTLRGGYSRRTSTGLIRAARRAGSQAANPAATASTTTATRGVETSRAGNP